MFFLWIRGRLSGKEYYLPRAKNWSGRLHISSNLTGAASIELPVVASEGVFTIELPDGFSWGSGDDAGKPLEHCRRITMESKDVRLDIFVAKCTPESMIVRKFRFPDQPVTIGSRPDNLIQYAEPPVSRNHAVLAKYPDGTCQYTDRSRFGSYVNNQFCSNASRVLHFGDRILILPALHLIYLGECFVVDRTDETIFSPMLTPFSPIPEEEEIPVEDTAVSYEYHRVPRHVQQPREEEIEIDPPIEKERRKEMPTWLAIGPSFTMILPMLMSTLVAQRNMSSSLVMIGTSSALAVMWASFNRRYQKKQGIENEENRQRICNQYYAEMEELLIAETERERKRLLYNHLSVDECIDLPNSKAHRLWERMPTHDDFLLVRLGLGERSLPSRLNIKRNRIALTDDPLRNEAQRLYDQYNMMHDVPIMLSLMKNQIVGVLGTKALPWMMQSLAVQAAANHSYHDVRIVVLHTKEDAQQWTFAKWLPHVFAADDRTLRMVVSDANAIREVLNHIDGVLTMRAEMSRSMEDEGKTDENAIAHLPWYLIFCTDPTLLEDQPIMRHLTSTALGATLILQTESMELLPKECFAVLEARERLGAVYTMDGKMTGVRFESATEDRLQSFSQNIASVRIKETTENSAIPSLVTFLETYQARQVEDIDIRYLWSENHAWNSIKACLGFRAGSLPFILDISDKNHGPHGLIAGTTGAGKSVLLQTFILSLALNYSPTEVQFILIDYKGGGTSEDFRTLPHAAGIIDSLQGERMIFRALASIKGEILRREEIFKNVGVNNIDDYMKYYNHDSSEESLGHLIIIVDEFAELKKEQPDFMRELVSAARVGRSLGMHLVLATQKPSNSVSDEIAANTRFRICLRVASKSDSSEMLKRPEAAYLKGMGRCYVQVGNDEVFEQVQTSYSGAAYSPDALRSEEEPQLLSETGQMVKLKRRKQGKDDKTQSKTELDAVLEYLNHACEQYHFEKARRMWLDELAQLVYLHQIPALQTQVYTEGHWPAVHDGELLAYYAMADDVEKQRHIPVALDFIGDKNQMIVGLSGSGKTTLLQTVAVSLALRYSPEELVMYVFSLTSRVLSSLASLPHVGEIVYEDEEDEQVRLMELIYQESERRKKLFAQLSTDNYIQYNRAARSSRGDFEPVPAMVVFIDRMQQLREWADKKLESKLQLFYDMLRSASSQGIYFVITAFDRSELPGKYQSFVHGIALQMNDRLSYADALGTRIPIEWGGIREYPGRGMIAIADKEAKLTRIYETQTAVYETACSDAQRAEAIRNLGENMRSAWTGRLPRGINRIPADPTLSMLLQNADMQSANRCRDRLPAFYAKNTGMAQALDLRECFSMLITGPRKSGKTNLLKNIATVFAQKQAKIHLIGSADLLAWGRQRGINVYDYKTEAWDAAFTELFTQEIVKRSGLLKAAADSGGQAARSALLETFVPIVVLIDDFDQYLEKNGDVAQAVTNLKHFCADIVSGYGIYTYITLSHASYQRCRIKEPVLSMAQAHRGVALQGRLSECDPFDTLVAYNQKSVVLPLGEGWFVMNQEAQHVVIPKCDD